MLEHNFSPFPSRLNDSQTQNVHNTVARGNASHWDRHDGLSPSSEKGAASDFTVS